MLQQRIIHIPQEGIPSSLGLGGELLFVRMADVTSKVKSLQLFSTALTGGMFPKLEHKMRPQRKIAQGEQVSAE